MTGIDIDALRRRIHNNQGSIYLAKNYHAARNFRQAARRRINAKKLTAAAALERGTQKNNLTKDTA